MFESSTEDAADLSSAFSPQSSCQSCVVFLLHKNVGTFDRLGNHHSLKMKTKAALNDLVLRCVDRINL